MQEEADMRISLAEYAKNHGITIDTARQRVLRGLHPSAHKIGRNWTIEDDDPYVDGRQAHNTDGFTGWCIVDGYDVYCENGRVLRGIGTDTNGGKVTVYPYRACKNGGWDKDTPRIQTLRSGICNGNWRMM